MVLEQLQDWNNSEAGQKSLERGTVTGSGWWIRLRTGLSLGIENYILASVPHRWLVHYSSLTNVTTVCIKEPFVIAMSHVDTGDSDRMGRQCFFDRSGRAWEDVESISLHKTGKVTGSLGFTGASLDLVLERCMGV